LRRFNKKRRSRVSFVRIQEVVMIVSPVGGVNGYVPISQLRTTVRKSDGDTDDKTKVAARGSDADTDGSAKAVTQLSSSAPKEVVKPVEAKISLTSDKVYDKRDANKDGTVSYQESLTWDSSNPKVAQSSSQAADNTVAYNQQGKTPAPGTGAPQSTFNLFV
jgi:hypothetical protein